MSLKTDTILFDADGTLIDTRRDIWTAVNLAFERAGLAPVSYERTKQYIGPGSKMLIYNLLPPEHRDRTPEVLANYLALYMEHALDETDLYPGMRDVLTSLSHRTLTVATNKSRPITERILEGLDARGFFEVVFGPEDVEQLKPHPEMILKTLEVTNTTADRAIIVGDTPNDIRSGKAGGIRTCAVTYGYYPKEALIQEEPDFIVDSVMELIPLLDEGRL